jgi:hypothetical protein
MLAMHDSPKVNPRQFIAQAHCTCPEDTDSWEQYEDDVDDALDNYNPADTEEG